MGNDNRFENFYSIDYGVLNVDDSSLATTGCDAGFCALTGYTADEISDGIALDKLFDKDSITAFVEFFKFTKDAPDYQCYEHCMFAKDGKRMGITNLVYSKGQGNGAVFHVNRPVGIGEDGSGVIDITSLKILDTILSGIPGAVAIYEYDNDSLKVIKASDSYYKTLGFGSRDNTPTFVGAHFAPEKNDVLFEKIKTCVNENKTVFGEFGVPCADGVMRWFETRAKPFISFDKKQLIFVIINDITRSKQQENEIKRQNERFELIARSTGEIFFDYDVKNDRLTFPNSDNYISRYNSVIEGYYYMGKYKEFMAPEDVERMGLEFKKAVESPTVGALEYRTNAYDDDYAWYKMQYKSVADENGRVSNVYGRIASIETEQMLKKRIDSDRKLIEKLSETDLVTGLYNRHTFKEKAAKYIKEIDDKRCYAVVYSDINDFSYVNENFGYDAGNRMLLDFADIIRGSGVLVFSCRIYSDFYVGLYVAETRDKLIKAINKRNTDFTELQKERYPASDINISSGMYFITDKNVDITVAMDNANLARRNIKGSDDVLCGIYSERMRKERLRDQSIASEVKTAMEQGKIELFLQPKFDLVTREIIGAEALARWRNTDGSYKMPYEFISVLERVGLIIEFDFYMYEQVLKCFVKWKQEGRKLVPISVNFSRVHSNKDNFVDRVNSLADKYGVDKSLIEIEITESAFVEDVNIMIRYLSKLREFGFKIDIDDFGMGYSSLSVLLNAPVDIVKVDKVFIDNIATNLLEREYVKQICSLIATTHKEVIFEGVETEEQATFLSGIGYNMAQGWLFDKAIPVPEFEKKYIS